MKPARVILMTLGGIIFIIGILRHDTQTTLCGGVVYLANIDK